MSKTYSMYPLQKSANITDNYAPFVNLKEFYDEATQEERQEEVQENVDVSEETQQNIENTQNVVSEDVSQAQTTATATADSMTDEEKQQMQESVDAQMAAAQAQIDAAQESGDLQMELANKQAELAMQQAEIAQQVAAVQQQVDDASTAAGIEWVDYPNQNYLQGDPTVEVNTDGTITSTNPNYKFLGTFDNLAQCKLASLNDPTDKFDSITYMTEKYQSTSFGNYCFGNLKGKETEPKTQNFVVTSVAEPIPGAAEDDASGINSYAIIFILIIAFLIYRARK